MNELSREELLQLLSKERSKSAHLEELLQQKTTQQVSPPRPISSPSISPRPLSLPRGIDTQPLSIPFEDSVLLQEHGRPSEDSKVNTTQPHPALPASSNVQSSSDTSKKYIHFISYAADLSVLSVDTEAAVEAETTRHLDRERNLRLLEQSLSPDSNLTVNTAAGTSSLPISAPAPSVNTSTTSTPRFNFQQSSAPPASNDLHVLLMHTLLLKREKNRVLQRSNERLYYPPYLQSHILTPPPSTSTHSHEVPSSLGDLCFPNGSMAISTTLPAAAILSGVEYDTFHCIQLSDEKGGVSYGICCTFFSPVLLPHPTPASGPQPDHDANSSAPDSAAAPHVARTYAASTLSIIHRTTALLAPCRVIIKFFRFAIEEKKRRMWSASVFTGTTSTTTSTSSTSTLTVLAGPATSPSSEGLLNRAKDFVTMLRRKDSSTTSASTPTSKSPPGVVSPHAMSLLKPSAALPEFSWQQTDPTPILEVAPVTETQSASPPPPTSTSTAAFQSDQLYFPLSSTLPPLPSIPYLPKSLTFNRPSTPSSSSAPPKPPKPAPASGSGASDGHSHSSSSKGETSWRVMNGIVYKVTSPAAADVPTIASSTQPLIAPSTTAPTPPPPTAAALAALSDAENGRKALAVSIVHSPTPSDSAPSTPPTPPPRVVVAQQAICIIAPLPLHSLMYHLLLHIRKSYPSSTSTSHTGIEDLLKTILGRWNVLLPSLRPKQMSNFIRFGSFPNRNYAFSQPGILNPVLKSDRDGHWLLGVGLGKYDDTRMLPSQQEWSTACLVIHLPPPIVLKLINLLLMEKSLIVISPRDPGIVSAVVMGVGGLIHPFRWEGLVIPLIPNGLRDLFGAPVPFIVGAIGSTPSDRDLSPTAAVLVLTSEKGELGAYFHRLPEVEADMPPQPSLLDALTSTRRLLNSYRRNTTTGKTIDHSSIDVHYHRMGMRDRMVIAGLLKMLRGVNEGFGGGRIAAYQWARFVKPNPRTGQAEFHPQLFIEPLRSLVDFQHVLSYTQHFASYLDSLRGVYEEENRYRIFIREWLVYRILRKRAHRGG